MGLIAKFHTLKEHNVVKMYALGPDPIPKTDAKNIIFITRPNLKSMDFIAGNIIKGEERGGGEHEHLNHKVQSLINVHHFSSQRLLPVFSAPEEFALRETPNYERSTGQFSPCRRV